MSLSRGPAISLRSASARLPRLLPLALLGVAALLAVFSTPVRAHEVPARVAVQMIARAQSDRLTLVVRVPLESVRDIEVPLWGGEYLDIDKVTPLLGEAATLWIAGYLELFEGDRRLNDARVAGTRVTLPSDRSFESFERARTNTLSAPLPNETELPWRQAMLDVVLEYPVVSAASSFSVRPLLAHLGVSTTTVLRWVTAGGDERAYQYVGNPGLVRFDPGVLHAARQFVALGFGHILGGIDHLLFLLCLLLPVRRLRPLIGVVTAFTAAHSITLVASALGMAPSAAWFPPLVEVLIAASIVALALENIVGARVERRWMVAFGFGLVHGFGFSFALEESLQFAGRHLLASLLAFNVGVELGQLLAIAVAIPVVALLFKRVVPERMGTMILSAMVAHESWHWMTARFAMLREFRFARPALDVSLALTLVRGMMLLLIIVAALWAVGALVARLARTPAQSAGWTLALAVCIVVGAAPRAQAQGAEATRSTLKGVFTDAQAARGKDIYVMSCRECHVPASHTGVMFRNSWGGKLLSDLLAYMTEKMPKNSPGSLTNEEYADVTAYILMLNGFPSGEEELPSDLVTARRIRIETGASAGAR